MIKGSLLIQPLIEPEGKGSNGLWIPEHKYETRGRIVQSESAEYPIGALVLYSKYDTIDIQQDGLLIIKERMILGVSKDGTFSPRSIIPKNNNVLFKIDNYDTIKLAGKDIWLERRENPGQHASVSGEVIAIPETLSFERENQYVKRNSMEWETDISVSVGDKCWVDYQNVVSALGKDYNVTDSVDDRKSIKDEKGNIYLFLHYGSLIVSRRGKDVICHNGYMLVQPLKVKPESKVLVMPDSISSKDSKIWGIVKYAGEPNKEYYNKAWHDDRQIRVGDIVMLEKSWSLYLEYPVHCRFEDKKMFYKVQRRGVMCILADGKVSDFEPEL